MNETKLLDGICQFLQNISNQTQTLFNEVQKEKGRQDASVQIERNAQLQALRLAVDGKKDNVIPFYTKNKNAPTIQSESVIKNTNDEKVTVATGGETMPPKLKYGQGSICKRERKNKKGVYTYWQGRFMDNGYQRTVTASTLKGLLDKMSLVKVKNADKNTDYVVSDRQNNVSSATKYGDWLSIWYEKYKKTNIKESYRINFERYINQNISPALGKYRLYQIDTLKLQDFFLQFNDKPNTRKKLFDIINASLRKLVETRVLKFNPCDAVDIKSHKTKKTRAYEIVEQNQMLEKLDKKYKAVFYFLCCTGLRVGEFLALTDRDVDEKRHMINVNKSFSRDLQKIVETKTGETRKVAYLDELLDVVKEYIGEMQFFGSYTYSGIRSAFEKVKKSLDITGVSPVHGTRHTFASVCYLERVPDKQTQQWLGHATMSMTVDTYTDLLNEGTSPIRTYINHLKNAKQYTN